MSERIAQRTIVKSPPEVWAEVSDVAALARHLGELGEIRITRTVPETAVAWAAGELTGTVSLDASGWGTRVTLTATMPDAAAHEPVAPDALAPQPLGPEPTEGDLAPEGPDTDAPDTIDAATATSPAFPAPAPRQGGLRRLTGIWRRRRRQPDPVPEPEVAPAPEPEPPPPPAPDEPRPAAPIPLPRPPATEPEPPPAAAETPAPISVEQVDAVLAEALVALGSPRNRPFSRP